MLYSRGSATYRSIERWFLKMKTPLRDPIELGSMEAIKELVKLGLGISMMAPWVARPELIQGSLVWLPLPGSRVARRWCIAAPTGRALSLAEQTFIGLCRSAASHLGAFEPTSTTGSRRASAFMGRRPMGTRSSTGCPAAGTSTTA